MPPADSGLGFTTWRRTGALANISAGRRRTSVRCEAPRSRRRPSLLRAPLPGRGKVLLKPLTLALSPKGRGKYSGADVLVHPEHVVRIVFPLEADQPVVFLVSVNRLHRRDV